MARRRYEEFDDTEIGNATATNNSSEEMSNNDTSFENKQLQLTLKLLKDIHEAERQVDEAANTLKRQIETLTDTYSEFVSKEKELREVLEKNKYEFTPSEESMALLQNKVNGIIQQGIDGMTKAFSNMEKTAVNSINSNTNNILAGTEKQMKAYEQWNKNIEEQWNNRSKKGTWMSDKARIYWYIFVVTGVLFGAGGLYKLWENSEQEKFFWVWIVAIGSNLLFYAGKWVWQKTREKD